MPSKESLQRVSRKTPCPVCGKPDWCLAAQDGSAAICARIDEGSIKCCGDAGWLHILRKDRHRPQRWRPYTRRISTSDDKAKPKGFEGLARQYQGQLTVERLEELSTLLGVTVESLKQLGIGFDGQAYTFPMSDFQGRIIGVRRRFPNGHKISKTGSKTGLFVPAGLLPEGILLICEGPTDTAAALDLGFNAIGRPNCNCKIKMTVKAARSRTEIVIISDNDKAGKAGAAKLANALALHYPSVRIIYPPDGIKDLRQWLQTGLTGERLGQIIENTKAIQIRISFED